MIRFNPKWWTRWVIVSLFMPILAQAELTVIYDNGQTKPIAPFLEVFGSNNQIPRQSQKPSTPLLGAADPQAWLPIQSPGLTPGQVQPRKHNKPFTRPFFMIGSDKWSRQWLKVHRDRLKEIGAVGMLVQAETLADLNTIAELADGLSILPASGADIAQALGITHYPVLISAQGIEQ
jgi:integrating conjugative element protein (TIGR03765 family)